MSRTIPVIEIGGSHVAAALVDLGAFAVVAGSGRRVPLDADLSVESFGAAVASAADGIVAHPHDSWGVAIPGPFDYDKGIALYSGVAKFDKLYGVDVGALLRGRLRPAPGRVSFVNDANAFLLGEWAAGAARGYERAAGITLGTGVGSAFLVRGQIVDDDPALPPDGDVHHLKVGGRPLEDLVSTRAIIAAYNVATDGRSSAEEVLTIAERAGDGEAEARQVLCATMKTLGEAVAPILAGFRAEVVVFGGSMSRSWELLEPALRVGLDKGRAALTRNLRVERAANLTDAALLGAAVHASRARPSGHALTGGL